MDSPYVASGVFASGLQDRTAQIYPASGASVDAGPEAAEHPANFDLLTSPNALQRRAFELIEQIGT
jgi:hypothetical protein